MTTLTTGTAERNAIKGATLSMSAAPSMDEARFISALYWEDGSSVVGPCSTNDPEPIEYEGMSQRDAQSWVDRYCR